MRMYQILFALPLVAAACSSDDPKDSPEKPVPTEIMSPLVKTISNLSLDITTDLAFYGPGGTVSFSLTGNLPNGARIRYRHGADVLKDEALSAKTWTWTVPSEDYKGYMADIYTVGGDNAQTLYATVGIDVSSNWKKFPRYGFIATYDRSKTDDVIANEFEFLNRCHINGLQFYDWHYKHHWPLGGTPGNLLDTYTDIANREISTHVVKEYIAQAHGKGMKTMFYNLCYGVLNDAESDGVKSSWYIFHDTGHKLKDTFPLSSSWKSDIFMVDPANTGWQEYMGDRVDDVYAALGFDGYHVDQLGSRGTCYDYYGSKIDLRSGFGSFLNYMKKRQPQKSLVMNAVSNWGAENIVSGNNVDFMYTEIWGSEDQFSDLYSIMNKNKSYCNGSLNQVYAAYMNYNQKSSYFNTPGVLLTDAVMFALGASHLELGDGHMLSKEYFPNDNVKMSDELKTAIVHYYDFLVAYQNLLRDGGEETVCDLATSKENVTLNAWPPVLKSVTTFSKKVGNKNIVHLMNFTNADNLSWRDIDGTQPEPDVISNINLRTKAKNVTKVWAATPDVLGGAPQELNFKQEGDYVTFTVPSLKYWTMIVVE